MSLSDSTLVMILVLLAVAACGLAYLASEWLARAHSFDEGAEG